MTTRSFWTHSFCLPCYQQAEPGLEPRTMKDKEEEICCRCGQAHRSGIYYRANPYTLRCRGMHTSSSERRAE